MKKLVALTAALLLGAVLLSACGQGMLRMGPEPVTLRFAYRANTMDVESLLAEFRDAHPHITVEAVEVDRWGDAMRQQVTQGQIDLFRDSREALVYAGQDQIRPLDPVQLADWDDVRDDYFRGAWESLAIGGQQWGIPAGMDTMALYANMDQVRALGLTLPTPDQRWGPFEFLEMANALNFPEGLPHDPASRLFGFCTEPYDLDPFVFVYLWGGRIVDDLNAPQRVTLDQIETIEAVRWYSDLFTRYQVSPAPATVSEMFRQGGIREAQTTGHCGLWLGLYSNRGGLDTPFRWSSAWEMLPVPRQAGDFDLADVHGYFVTQSSAHPQEALLLAHFMTERWQSAGAQLPARKSQVADPAYAYTVGERVADQARSLGDDVIIIPVEFSPQLATVGEAVLQTINQAITQGHDVEPLLIEAQERLQRGF